MRWLEHIQISLDPANIAAVAISLFAVGLSVWQISLNRPRIRVLATENHVEEGSPGVRWLLVEVVNFGVHPTGIKQLTICTFEPLRVCRRLHSLRGWSHEQAEDPAEVFAGGA
jgi:hypothetical protein